MVKEKIPDGATTTNQGCGKGAEPSSSNGGAGDVFDSLDALAEAGAIVDDSDEEEEDPDAVAAAAPVGADDAIDLRGVEKLAKECEARAWVTI